jgi:tRNA pseudouridine55 synthase
MIPTMQMKSRSRAINGILLLDKPCGFSSNQVLGKVKRSLNAKKAGHTGSLDPLASGMLPICFGEATKFARFFLEADKSYLVTAQFGQVSSTGDAEGVITSKQKSELTLEHIESALPQFRGDIKQIPPMFSAIKVNGKPLYKLARKGIDIDREPRSLHIHKFTCTKFDSTLQQGEFVVTCSKGTYIRSLIQDLGESLGSGAYVTSLKRLWVAPFQEFSMVTYDDAITDIGLERVLPISLAMSHLPKISLNHDLSTYLSQGQGIQVDLEPVDGFVALNNHEGNFIGVGHFRDDGRIFPTRLLQTV